MLTVISKNFDDSMTHGSVIVECNESEPNKAYEELRGPAARNEAIKTAAVSGMADPRINDNPQIFAVDAAGEVIKDPSKQKTAKYRARINLIRKLV
jgi:hypothetical protein